MWPDFPCPSLPPPLAVFRTVQHNARPVLILHTGRQVICCLENIPVLYNKSGLMSKIEVQFSHVHMEAPG